MSADLLLVVGSTGAGKSTFARELASRSGGVCFIVDEWMQRLFHPERPSDAGYEWYAPRIERCTELIWSLSTDLVRVGTPSVLEIGLTRRAARAAFYERARAAQLRVQLHALDPPAAVRWQRVEERNRARGATGERAAHAGGLPLTLLPRPSAICAFPHRRCRDRLKSRQTCGPGPPGVPMSDVHRAEPPLPTGIEGLDHVLLGGYRRDGFYLIQGDPGSGKTTLALQFMQSRVRAGDACLYISLESRNSKSVRAVRTFPELT